MISLNKSLSPLFWFPSPARPRELATHALEARTRRRILSQYGAQDSSSSLLSEPLSDLPGSASVCPPLSHSGRSLTVLPHCIQPWMPVPSGSCQLEGPLLSSLCPNPFHSSESIPHPATASDKVSTFLMLAAHILINHLCFSLQVLRGLLHFTKLIPHSLRSEPASYYLLCPDNT